MKIKNIVAAALVAAAIAGCSGGGGGKAPSVVLTGAGATFPYPIYSKWFEMYHESTGVQINYQSIGSGGGIQQLKAGTVDFGASDAALNDEKLKEMPHSVLHVPTVAGAVVLAYNLPELTQPLQLSPQALAGIFMGTVKTWNDPAIKAANPGTVLPATAVLAVHRSDGSGTSNIFTTYLSAVSPEWKSQVGANTSVAWPAGVGAKGNEGVSGQVKQTPGSIGYVELAYAKQSNMTVAKLQNASGAFIEPSLASTTAAIQSSAQALAADVRATTVNAAGPDAYPIAALTFILVYEDQKDATKGKEIANFLNWAIHQGQDQVEALQYARLPAEVVSVDEATIARITSGGKPLASR
jgi:phosphate transport system substrate-binding protein